MSQQGSIMITMMFTASAENVAEGDRIFESHASWMASSHHRDGELELQSYSVTKNVEYSNPLDPSSAPTGNTIFTICEVYANPAGLADHWKRGEADWEDFGALMEWAGKGKMNVSHGSPIVHSLW